MFLIEIALCVLAGVHAGSAVYFKDEKISCSIHVAFAVICGLMFIA